MQTSITYCTIGVELNPPLVHRWFVNEFYRFQRRFFEHGNYTDSFLSFCLQYFSSWAESCKRCEPMSQYDLVFHFWSISCFLPSAFAFVKYFCKQKSPIWIQLLSLRPETCSFPRKLLINVALRVSTCLALALAKCLVHCRGISDYMEL